MAGLPLFVRRLTEVDDALAARLNPLFDDGGEWDAIQGRIFVENSDNLFLAAFWDGEACGFLTAHRLQRFDRRRAEVLLYEISVDERFQRRGVGTALIAAVNRWARDVGADEVWVLTNAGNDAAMTLYQRTGGTEDVPGTTMFTYRIE
jgi:GNAT superfamily N-acetyltransferase